MFNSTDYARKRRKRLHDQGLCAQCGKRPNLPNHLFCSECALKARIRERNRLANPEIRKQARERTHLWKKTMRIRALEKIAKDNNLPLKCPCGCDEIEFLEINHLNGYGSQEYKTVGGGSAFYRKIVRGERTTADLNILCKVCNAAYFLSKKTGKRWKIVYQG